MAVDPFAGIFKSRATNRSSQDSPPIPKVEENGLPSLPKVIDPSLTPQQCAAIAHLVAGKNLSSIATLLEIDRKTLYNWRQLPAFKNAVYTLSVEACEAAAMRMRNIVLRGTHKLASLIDVAANFNDLLKLISNKRIWEFAHVMPEGDGGDSSEETENDPAPAPVKPDSECSDEGHRETVRREDAQTEEPHVADACVDRIAPRPRQELAGEAGPAPARPATATAKPISPLRAIRSPSPAP